MKKKRFHVDEKVLCIAFIRTASTSFYVFQSEFSTSIHRDVYSPSQVCVFYTQTLNCGNFKGPKYKSVMVWGFSAVQVELLR